MSFGIVLWHCPALKLSCCLALTFSPFHLAPLSSFPALMLSRFHTSALMLFSLMSFFDVVLRCPTSPNSDNVIASGAWSLLNVFGYRRDRATVLQNTFDGGRSWWFPNPQVPALRCHCLDERNRWYVVPLPHLLSRDFFSIAHLSLTCMFWQLLSFNLFIT